LGSDPPKTEWAEAFEIYGFCGEKIGRRRLHTDGAITHKIERSCRVVRR